MSFLFKGGSKKAQPGTALPPATRDLRSSDSSVTGVPSFNGKPSSPTPISINASLNSVAGEKAGSARQSEDLESSRAQQEQKSLREASREVHSMLDNSTSYLNSGKMAYIEHTQPQRMPPSSTTATGTTTRPDSSPYPFSQRKLTFSSALGNNTPFPRYGAAVNATGSKDGSIYLMGGLINGSTVKGDLWMVEATQANMTCFPVATTSEGPGPRVGHASLLVGNAFIVFGGDTKMDEGDMLDDTLYLLNTSTKQWSRALPAGPRPPGRYGHTLNILGSKIFIFGGQVEGYFFNDLVAFDLNALQQPANKWDILIQNTIDGGPPHGQIPPARTNHTMITYGDKLFLFGGTDGVHWFNDVWSYSPTTNAWTQLECIGYIPSAREGHAAALVGDVMYIFGGRTEEGTDLGDLAAFRISTRRWYTFQNMGPSPSPRSGHSMTTVGKQVVILAGEPSSAPRDAVELGMAYFLDTTKIRYPPDSASQIPVNERVQGHKQPTGVRTDALGSQKRGPPSRQSNEQDRSTSSDNRIRSPDGSRLPRAQAQLPAPTGPPPLAPSQQRPLASPPASRQPTRSSDRPFGALPEEGQEASYDNTGLAAVEPARQTPTRDVRIPTSPTYQPEQIFYDSEENHEPAARQKPETYQPSQDAAEPYQRSFSRTQAEHEPERSSEPIVETTGIATAPEALSKARKMSEDRELPQDSGLGSSPAFTQQHDNVMRELDQIRQKNAWYASELALARKAGYQARSTDSPVLDQRASAIINDEDRPLVEALLKMRAELARVQDTIDTQSKSAAERIAEIEKQRDVAINEAVFAKAKLAGQGSPYPDAEPKGDRNNDISRRLALSLEAQGRLDRRIAALMQDVEGEKRSRELAQGTADAAQKRVKELDSYKQQHASEVESLRAELHEAERSARDASANYAEATAQHQILSVEKTELHSRLERAKADSQNHTSILTSLRDAVTASTEKARLLEQKLEEERNSRSDVERNLRELKVQHDERSNALDDTSRQLRDAQELAERHAEEARTHRQAVLAGLGNMTSADDVSTGASQERLTVMQQQVDTANGLVRQNQAAADAASEKLRRAEERIAGLEAYQEQASREGLSLRKQLQSILKENQGLASEKSELEQRMERTMLETNALSVQHASLKDILGERGINPADVRRSRAIDSPSSARFSTPDLHRVRELEVQLEASLKSHDDMRNQFEEVTERDEKMKREYEEKLTALDNDHQAAVKYLRGTEKMLSKMKQELQRVKNENGELKKKVEKAKDEAGATKNDAAGTGLEVEREQHRAELAETQASHQASMTGLESQIAAIEERLRSSEAELHESRAHHVSAQRDLSDLQASHSQSRSDIERLQKENGLLEVRAKDAENKVQLLLDQVESSVDNYRRQSRMSAGAATLLNGTHHARSGSDNSDAAASTVGKTHNRNHSSGNDSTFSIGEPGTGDARNSMALDSLASELETLRSHWETTNRNYRLSDRFDTDRTPISLNPSGTSTLADWRRGLDLDDDESRPTTSTSTVRGDEDETTPVKASHHAGDFQS